MAARSLTPIDPAQFAQVRERVTRIEAAARGADGHTSLNDAVWRDLDAAAPDSAGFFSHDFAYAHVARSDTFSPRHWAVGVTIRPDARDSAVRRALLAAAVDHIARHGGGRAVYWVLGADDRIDRELTALGWRADRDLYEMRVALPLRVERMPWPDRFTVRTFEPGRDDAAWLEVNNRAFANHAEQGGWIEETLQRRLHEDWFDPSIFLLAFDASGLAGFNWMKIYDPEGRGVLGEIFVIGVDPRAQGTGLGRALAVSGLDAVHERGVKTGSLFVAAESTAAVGLYRSLGFDVHRADRAYEYEVPAA